MTVRQTLDEVVAANLTAIVETKRVGESQLDPRPMTMADLARRLHRPEHVVRDMFRPREKGGPQRAFKWSEIVALCAALKVTVAELVLPADGVVIESLDSPLMIPDVIGLKVQVRTDEKSNYSTVFGHDVGRRGLSETLFGIDDKNMRELAGYKQRRLTELVNEFKQRLRDIEEAE